MRKKNSEDHVPVDPIEEFYREMAKVHKERFPGWRFGQLMNNFFYWLEEQGIDVFFPEDMEMLERFKQFSGDLN